ncbi:hypothetical protein F5J12DRAFT_154005 [Pisolithus orientalis]|uniref:uncharacterized protein n=1 Tax=Pisolithus orientalis TaxID=936130 RepID=UPI002224DBB2|nr:uncharacterized protein F5J12DRAFT_154005 [Pisolithus orientalis]KAI6003439.1 hypothetical protein F5J12DRAFT_154005 [Pisolithus orientalis]
MMTGVESQSASSCSLPGCAGEVPMEFPSSRPAYCLDPVKAKQHVDRIRHFRILVMGRANAGKTTILQRVCNTMDEPEIVNREGWKLDANVVQASLAHGEHNIEDELIFRSHPQFIFHDSCGFEAGSEKQFDMMKKFVLDRARTPKLDERIHAIWFCVPLNESHRMITAAERKFFDECDTGHVPVILLSTKADSLELEVFEQLEDQGFDVDDATRAKEMEEEILSNYIVKLKNWLNNLEFPPHDYLSLSSRYSIHMLHWDCQMT